jgi:hypothetical protein
VASVALPTVGRAVRGVAPDHEPLATLFATAAAGDVANDDPISGLEAARTGADGLDKTRGLVAGHDVLVALVGVRSPVLVVDGPQVVPAKPRRLHLHQDLAVPRLRDVQFLYLDPLFAG